MNDLDKGINAHQANDIKSAKKYYLQHLDVNNKDPNANQLLGLIYFNEKKFQLAQKYMDCSLRSNPNQPHVLVNLSSTLVSLGLFEDAINRLLSAIKIDSNYIDAYINLVRIYRKHNRLVEAEDCIKYSLIKFPNNIKFIKELGALYKSTNRLSDLIGCYKEYEILYPEDLKLKFDLGLSLRSLGRSREALIYYKILIDSGMKNYQLYHNMGNAYSDLGELDNAIINYSHAIQENPLYIESHINLNELLWENNQLNLFLGSYINVLKLFPENLDLNFNYISALVRTSNFTQAEIEIHSLPPSVYHTNEMYLLSARCLYHKNNKSRAIHLLEKNINFDGVDEMYVLEYSKYLIEDEQPSKAVQPLVNLLKRSPSCQMAIAYLGTCYRLTNNKQEELFNNYKSMVKEYKLNVPSEYVSITEFCLEINDYLSEIHTSEIQPLEQTLSNGTQTRGNLFDNKTKLLSLLISQIELCLTHYNNSLSESNGDYGIKPVDEYTYAGSWSVRLKKQGYHSMHVHPMGWLSAVYYVDLPSEISTTDNHNGWLKFGEPNFNLTPPLPPAYYAKPEIGKLVIFPSYMWHGTVPFESNENRTTIAFDVREIIKT